MQHFEIRYTHVYNDFRIIFRFVNNHNTHVFTEMTKRKYHLKRRAERQEETRQRIVDAAIALHEIDGNSATISAVAERAGVERLTVYRHFPNEWELARACVQHYYTLSPQPDPAHWQHIEDAETCLRTALTEIYAYHQRTERMSASARRGAETMPDLRDILAPYFDHWMQVRDWLAGKFSSDTDPLRRAAIGHAIDFTTWRSLVREQELDDQQAIELMMGMIKRVKLP
jgi:AcrR family transcriptional regulator